ncbi:hypothetical protein VaNZ11_001056 [Volvox africanus]|uniref:Uncharacterized protein n=4 Tax=Volvox TaxID=3066 RepID=A0ABQ5RNT9_9CHLO|nr:hypothetical protein VaNZ11_001056 [Volvox africanus]
MCLPYFKLANCFCWRLRTQMSAQGTALQNHNNELVKCIEDLREKREEIIKQLREDDAEKAKITQDLQILTKRLAQVNDSIARKTETKNEYDKVISETEAAYLKILESSQTLLTVLKREAVNIAKKKQASS